MGKHSEEGSAQPEEKRRGMGKPWEKHALERRAKEVDATDPDEAGEREQLDASDCMASV